MSISTSMGFRARLIAGELLVGSFIKTPAPHMVEIAALSSMDFALLDAEHAPFTVRDINLAILAGRAAQMNVLVRVPSATPFWIQQALDLGASGIVVPHVSSPAIAADVVRAARFGNGMRGYSNSTRAGGYGAAAMQSHLGDSDHATAVIVQIEDAEAVECVEEIAAVPGIDALFIGRADLAVAYGTGDPFAHRVEHAAKRIVDAARANGVAAAGFHADAASFNAAQSGGVSMFVVGSDQSMLKAAWSAAVRDMRARVRQEAG